MIIAAITGHLGTLGQNIVKQRPRHRDILAIGFRHAFVPTGKRFSVRFEIAHHIPRPQWDGCLIHRAHGSDKVCEIHQKSLESHSRSKTVKNGDSLSGNLLVLRVFLTRLA